MVPGQHKPGGPGPGSGSTSKSGGLWPALLATTKRSWGPGPRSKLEVVPAGQH